jgi:predicted HTH transcriptional regulator
MQITKHLFAQILFSNEADKIDFKRDQYPLENDRQKSEFIKDIVSIANTQGDGSGYIVLGIKSEPNGSKVRFGIKNHHDDAMLQQIVKDKVNPPPTFIYNPYQEENLSFGIIVIPKSKNRPHVIIKDYGILKRNAVYVRRGSSTDEAAREELEEMFHERCPKVREGELPTLAKFLQENLLQQVEVQPTSSPYNQHSIQKYDDNHIEIKNTDTDRDYSIPRPAISGISRSQKRNIPMRSGSV